MGALQNKAIIAKEEALSYIIPDQIDHLVSDVNVKGQLVMVACIENWASAALPLLLSSPSSKP